MSTPKNFPGRKNERRIRALARFNPKAPSRTGKRSRHEAEVEFARLSAAIVPQTQARAVRTKKDRSGRGNLTRQS